LPDYLQLNLVVLVWSFTAILGKLISLTALDVVIWRTGMATLGAMGLAKMMRQSLAVHWVLFFASARLSTASVCLAAMPMVMVWSSLIEPIINGTRRWRASEMLMGVIMVGAVWLIYRVEFRHSWGFTVGLMSAAMAAVFTVLNKQIAHRHHYSVMLTWQMLGACAVCLLVLPLAENRWLPLLPSAVDFGWLLVLSIVCTVAAYAAYIDVLGRMSVFTINIVYNLEPVYGIVLAVLIFGSSELLSSGFYLGTAIIVGAVVAMPLLSKRA
jgi:drug/metabolite transporter (DMT)-like permease